MSTRTGRTSDDDGPQSVPPPCTTAPAPLPMLLTVDNLRRLHGEVCFRCGAAEDLVSAGYAYTSTEDGVRYGWLVVTCPSHSASSPEPAPPQPDPC